MLVLGRKVNEAVLIRVGDTVVRVVACECRSDMVLIGFEADQGR